MQLDFGWFCEKGKIWWQREMTFWNYHINMSYLGMNNEHAQWQCDIRGSKFLCLKCTVKSALSSIYYVCHCAWGPL